jgi:hypothetical protein
MTRAAVGAVILTALALCASGCGSHETTPTVSKKQQALFTAAEERRARQRLADGAGAIAVTTHVGGNVLAATKTYLAAVDSVAGSVPPSFLIRTPTIGLASMAKSLQNVCDPCWEMIEAQIKRLRR